MLVLRHQTRVPILMVCLGLASATGCQVLGIPSYRADMGGTPVDPYTDGEIPGGDIACPPGVLPPMPGWLAAWHAKKELPQPPAYPRFLPLPTRPMFSPRASDAPIPMQGDAVGPMAAPRVHYGHWPSAGDGGPPGWPPENAATGSVSPLP